ncbi:MAG TPA: SMC-Scp complex subunit ScpB [Thermoanaerobaculia bacterium]
MEPNELRSALEAILFVSSDPVKIDDLAESFPEEGKDSIATQLEEMRRNLETNVGGFMLEQTAGGWRFATRPEYDSVLKKYFAKKGENRLSIAALETLAIVAYRQPITAPEVSDIRGVNSTGVIRTLLERRMIRVSGRKNVVGSPFLYRTTKEFLVHFGLNDIRDLPRLEEFGDLIGENINDDLVAAIANAEVGGEGTPVLPEDGTTFEENADDATLEAAPEASTETAGGEATSDASAEVSAEASDAAPDEPPVEMSGEDEGDADETPAEAPAQVVDEATDSSEAAAEATIEDAPDEESSSEVADAQIESDGEPTEH